MTFPNLSLRIVPWLALLLCKDQVLQLTMTYADFLLDNGVRFTEEWKTQSKCKLIPPQFHKQS